MANPSRGFLMCKKVCLLGPLLSRSGSAIRRRRKAPCTRARSRWQPGLAAPRESIKRVMPDDEGPSRAQIDDFIMRTGASPEEARFFLEATAGDVQAAATMFLEMNPEHLAHPGAQQHVAGVAGAAGIADADLVDGDAPEEGAGPVERHWGGPVATALSAAAAAPVAVFRVGFSLVSAVLGLGWFAVNSVGSLVLPDSVMAPVRRAVASLGSIAATADPEQAARDFIRAYEARYDSPRPPFEALSFRMALARSRAQGRFLLVFLHDFSEPDSDHFSRETLSSQAIVDVLREQFVVWGGDTAKSWDARQLRQAAGSPSTPYLAMMTATADGSSVSLVASFEGYLGPDRLLQELMLSLERYSRELAPVRERTSQAQRQREQDRRLREEQDAALRAALEADRAKEAARAAREEEERRAREEEERRAREAEERARAEREALERRRRDKAEALGEEPPATSAGCCTIRVRMPGGSNVARRFLESEPVAVLYDWVDSLDHDHVDYDLVSSFPRKAFPRSDSRQTTLRDAGLAPQAALFVQPVSQE